MKKKEKKFWDYVIINNQKFYTLIDAYKKLGISKSTLYITIFRNKQKINKELIKFNSFGKEYNLKIVKEK